MTNHEPDKSTKHNDHGHTHGHGHSDAAHAHDDSHGHGLGDDVGEIIPENSPQDWMLRMLAFLGAIGFIVFGGWMVAGWDFWYLNPPSIKTAEPAAQPTAAPPVTAPTTTTAAP